MNNGKEKEYQDNLPHLDDLKLLDAARIAIYIIVVRHGRKTEVIRNVASKHKVREGELLACVEIAIPAIFFTRRAEKARQRSEASFYQPPKIEPISDDEKVSGNKKLRQMRKMLCGK